MKSAVGGKLVDFVSRIEEEEHIIPNYVRYDAKLRPQIPAYLTCWIQIRFSN